MEQVACKHENIDAHGVCLGCGIAPVVVPRTVANVRTVGHALIDEIRRVRDEVMPAYILAGVGGELALANMRAELDAAVKALAYHDGLECMRLLASLREYHT